MKIIEFGVNEYPVFLFSRRIEEEIKSGAMYVGFDVDETALRITAQKYRKHMVLGDMGKIPLANCVADEIWVLNVFGGKFHNLPEKHQDGTLNYELGLNRHFREMIRILKPGGIIYVGEWLHPINNHSWLKDEDYSDFGLTKEVYEEENFLDFISQYGFRSLMIERDTPPFLIVLTKNN